jgi:hypothetical protein
MKRIVQIGVAALLVVLIASCARFRTGAPEVQADPPGIAVAPAPCLDVLPDSDGDGLSDACELALARAFAPRLLLHDTRCTLPAAGAGGHIAGGYFHAAQPARGMVRLVYMPAYYRDCGWRSAWCILIDCSGHAGDSEMIVVDVRPSENGGWITDAIFLSAHCYGNAEEDCRWFRGQELDVFEWVGGIERGAPIVWVSDGRNANYPSRVRCEQGHFGLDRCSRDPMRFRFPIAADRNIGSRAVPIRDGDLPAGCVSGRFVEPHDRMIVAQDALECFWDVSSPFGGWQGDAVGVTPYGRYLEDLGL